MKKQLITYKHKYADMVGRQFSNDYKEWVTKELIEYKCTIKFTSKTVTITGSMKGVYKSLIFLGYAFGQQDNGR